MKSTQYTRTEQFFVKLHEITDQSSKNAFQAGENVWESERSFDPASEIDSLFHSEMFDGAIAELKNEGTDEADFFIEGLLNTQWNYEFEKNADKEIESPTEQIQHWINQISEKNFALLLNAITKNFPISSSNIFKSLLLAEIHRYSPQDSMNEMPMKTLTLEKIFDCYGKMGLDMSLVLQKAVPPVNGNQSGGTAFMWTQNGENKLGLIYTKKEENAILTVMDAYVILHEMGHLMHFYICLNLPAMFKSAVPGMWSEAIADAFACFAMTMLDYAEDTELILKFLDGQRFHRIADALLIISDTSVKRHEEDETELIEYVASDYSNLDIMISYSISIIVAEKMVKMYEAEGIEYVRNFIEKTQGLELNEFTNEILRERLRELNILQEK